MIRVLVANTHTLLRLGLESIFGMTRDITVGSCATTDEELFALLPESRAGVILLDQTQAPPLNAPLIRKIKRRHPGLHILVLLPRSDEPAASLAMKAGADGCATLDTQPDELIRTLRHVARGNRCLTLDLLEASQNAPANRPKNDMDELSPRQLEILSLYAQGENLNDIANRLSLSPKTVSTHKMRLMQKLGLENNIDLARYSIRNGLVPRGSVSP